MTIARPGVVVAAVLALAAAPAATTLGAERGGADGLGAGVRAASGDGIYADEVYLGWAASFLQRHVVAPYLPAGGTARWEAGLSDWRADGDSAIVLAAGPTLEYALPWDRCSLALGIRPTIFSDYASDNRTLGGPFEFTSHAGMRWRLDDDWYLGARVQHTSNAGIYDRNPGVNLFALELGARF